MIIAILLFTILNKIVIGLRAIAILNYCASSREQNTLYSYIMAEHTLYRLTDESSSVGFRTDIHKRKKSNFDNRTEI